jgi:hypothetical protein
MGLFGVAMQPATQTAIAATNPVPSTALAIPNFNPFPKSSSNVPAVEQPIAPKDSAIDEDANGQPTLDNLVNNAGVQIKLANAHDTALVLLLMPLKKLNCVSLKLKLIACRSNHSYE